MDRAVIWLARTAIFCVYVTMAGMAGLTGLGIIENPQWIWLWPVPVLWLYFAFRWAD
ncbi:hypothetical protein JKG47_01690 [Acidithiobacillus sp. MC6.1]|nr:hypothetical protein [Acidithiobacillus sp. MC6.1]